MTGMMSENPVSEKFRRPIQAAVLISMVLSTNSCVPLLIGGVVGYVAHSEGFGVAKPLNPGSTKTYDEPAAYGDGGGYDAGDSDAPVY